MENLLAQAKRILICGPYNPDIDIVSTAIAWQSYLQKHKKQADIVFDGQTDLPSFVSQNINIDNKITNLNKFKIILDISKTRVKQLSYDVQDDQLVVNILPDGGVFSSKDVTIEQGDYQYDLVIVLGAQNLESLQGVFNEHRHFFHNVSIVNMDKSVFNENFGQLNIIDSKATSLAEISYEYLKDDLDKDIATCLLAGMISATNSFQSPQVTPQTLELASSLIIAGAEREKIIESLYRTKDIKTLKNWGKVLSRLKKSGAIVSSFLNYDEADNLPQDFQELVHDLILSMPETRVAIIFYQVELQATEVWLYTIANINALDLTKDLGGAGSKHFVKFFVDKDLENTSQLVISKIKEKLDKLNIG